MKVLSPFQIMMLAVVEVMIKDTIIQEIEKYAESDKI